MSTDTKHGESLQCQLAIYHTQITSSGIHST